MSNARNSQAGARSAAILISGLDTATADLLLDQLPPHQAALIRQAVMALRSIEPEEETRVLEQFRSECMGESKPASSDESLVNQPAPQPLDDRPFEFLRDATPRSVAELLAREHPQVVAVVVAHLPPEVAASVMSYWPESTQADVLARVAHLDELNAASLDALEEAIAGLLAGTVRPRSTRTAGVSAVEMIMKCVDNRDRSQLLTQIAKRDADLAASITGNVAPPRPIEPDVVAASTSTSAPTPQPPKPHIDFDDLEHFTSTDWATLLAAVDPQTMLLALAGASDRVMSSLQRFAPGDVLRQLEKRLRKLGPVCLEDIDRAQRRIADAAAEAIATGRIAAIQPRHFAAAI